MDLPILMRPNRGDGERDGVRGEAALRRALDDLLSMAHEGRTATGDPVFALQHAWLCRPCRASALLSFCLTTPSDLQLIPPCVRRSSTQSACGG